MSWSTKEKTFCVEAYFANNSYKIVQASFWRKFQCRHAPTKSRIFGWIQKFKEYGTVQNLNSKGLRDAYSGRTVTARPQRNIYAVQDSVGRSPKKSLKWLNCWVSQSSNRSQIQWNTQKNNVLPVIDNFARRTQVCLQQCGGHLEHILERTCLLCKETSKTETMGNDFTQTEV